MHKSLAICFHKNHVLALKPIIHYSWAHILFHPLKSCHNHALTCRLTLGMF